MRPRRAVFALAMGSVALGALGQVLLKSGAMSAGGGDGPAAALASALSSPLTWLGLLSYGLSAVVWLVVLSRLELSVAYPLGASGYVIVAVASVAMGEHVPAARWIGVAAIVGGILLVGWDADRGRERGA